MNRIFTSRYTIGYYSKYIAKKLRHYRTYTMYIHIYKTTPYITELHPDELKKKLFEGYIMKVWYTVTYGVHLYN